MSPIDPEKARKYTPGAGVLVTLTPLERTLIHEAFVVASHNYVYTPGEREAINHLLRRIPKD